MNDRDSGNIEELNVQPEFRNFTLNVERFSAWKVVKT